MKDKIRTFIRKNLIVFDDGVVFSDEDDIFKMGFVNSLFAIKLVNFIEAEYSISIEDEDMDISNFNSINNIELFVKKNKRDG